jgi:hypothetical protein
MVYALEKGLRCTRIYATYSSATHCNDSTVSKPAPSRRPLSLEKNAGCRVAHANGGAIMQRLLILSVSAVVTIYSANAIADSSHPKSQSSASVTDAVTDDTSTVQTVPGTDVGNVLAGPRTGQTFKLEGVAMRMGLISADGRTLIASDLTPGVETLTYWNGDVERRICWRSRVVIKLDADDVCPAKDWKSRPLNGLVTTPVRGNGDHSIPRGSGPEPDTPCISGLGQICWLCRDPMPSTAGTKS